MKKFICLQLACALCILPFCGIAQDIARKADALLTAYHKQDLFTGTVLIVKNNVIVFEQSYGMANREKAIPNSSSTRYRIGSLSKPVTAMIILQLQQKGLLHLGDPISNYFKDFPRGDSVTIKNLLSHTSGIHSITSTRQYRENRKAIKGMAEVLDILKSEPYDFTPGTGWQYSNSNYILLSYIAEKVSGKPMSVLVQHFANTLGMQHTGMDFDGRPDSLMAMGYKAGPITDYLPDTVENINVVTGAGGLYSTSRDLYLLDRALYTETILPKETLDSMYTPIRNDYGLGWETGRYKNYTETGHSGSIEGFKSQILRYPETGTCIIFLSNYWNTMGPAICEALKAIVFNEPFTMPVARTYVELSPQQMQLFTGEYQFNGGLKMQLYVENGILLSSIKGQPVVGFRPVPGNAFYNKSNNALIQFEKDKVGSFTSFQLIKGKQVMEWTRN